MCKTTVRTYQLFEKKCFIKLLFATISQRYQSSEELDVSNNVPESTLLQSLDFLRLPIDDDECHIGHAYSITDRIIECGGVFNTTTVL